MQWHRDVGVISRLSLGFILTLEIARGGLLPVWIVYLRAVEMWPCLLTKGQLEDHAWSVGHTPSEHLPQA